MSNSAQTAKGLTRMLESTKLSNFDSVLDHITNEKRICEKQTCVEVGKLTLESKVCLFSVTG